VSHLSPMAGTNRRREQHFKSFHFTGNTAHARWEQGCRFWLLTENLWKHACVARACSTIYRCSAAGCARAVVPPSLCLQSLLPEHAAVGLRVPLGAWEQAQAAPSQRAQVCLRAPPPPAALSTTTTAAAAKGCCQNAGQGLLQRRCMVAEGGGQRAQQGCGQAQQGRTRRACA